MNGTDDLLEPLRDDAARADEMDRVADTFDVLRRREDTLTTHASQRKYVQEFRQFYTHQVTFKSARHNPTDQLERRFGWDSAPEWDNQALEGDQYQRIVEVLEQVARGELSQRQASKELDTSRRTIKRSIDERADLYGL